MLTDMMRKIEDNTSKVKEFISYFQQWLTNQTENQKRKNKLESYIKLNRSNKHMEYISSNSSKTHSSQVHIKRSQE